MYQNGVDTLPIIQSVFHPTDFSPGSEVAFYHALKASLLTKSELTIMHVSSDGESGWASFPRIRNTLERWKLLPERSPKSAVSRLGITPVKIIAREPDPVAAVINFLKQNPADLIVLATHQFRGPARWLNRSVAEPVARNSGQMTLFIPANCKGFVSANDGSVSLGRILVPIADSPRAQPAVEAAARLATKLNLPTGVFTLLHVGDSASAMPRVRCYEVEGWDWQKVNRSGEIISTILDTSSTINADLIVMSTDGRDGFLGAVRGSHCERVLRQCSVPLLTIPETSTVASFLS